MVLDIYSRYVMGWMLASRELGELAERLLADSIRKQGVDRNQLTTHADRGSSMASKPLAFLLADLGVTKSHSRPHCPNDNPFSESTSVADRRASRGGRTVVRGGCHPVAVML